MSNESPTQTSGESLQEQEPRVKVQTKFATAEEVEHNQTEFIGAYERPFLYKIKPSEIKEEGAEYVKTIANILQSRRHEYHMKTLLDTAVYSTDIPIIADMWELNNNNYYQTPKSQKEIVIGNIIQALHDGKMSPEDFVEILERYESTVNEAREWLKSKEAQIKEAFIADFMEKINPKLSTPRTQEDIEEILRNIRFTVQDPVGAQKDTGASHRSGSRIVTFSDIPLLQYVMHEERNNEGRNAYDDLEFIMIHELLHAITSSDIVIHERVSAQPDGNGTVTQKYYGAQWVGVTTGHKEEIKFSWLNEALTETYTSTMTGRDPISYEIERDMLRLFASKGVVPIDKQLFLDAYFERRGGEAKKEGVAHIHWKALIEATRKAYPHDPQFLVKFDTYIQQRGTAEAINILENWDPKHPADLQ